MRDKFGRTIAKANLPSKLCAICIRPFTWRKKWEATWDVRETCSKRCLGEARLRRRDDSGGAGGGAVVGAAEAGGARTSDTDSD